MMATSAAGELCPPLLIMDSDATDPENYTVPAVLLTDAMPTVTGMFGFGEKRTLTMHVTVSKEGGMTSKIFKKWLEIMASLFPGLSPLRKLLIKADGGPGRVNLENLRRCCELYIDLFPGMPAGSKFNQEMVRFVNVLDTTFHRDTHVSNSMRQ
jgi:hypothetical protein